MILRNAWSFNFVETNTIKTIGRRVLVSLKNGHKKYVDFDVPEDEYFNPDDLTFMRKKLFLRGVKDVLMVHDAGLAPEKHKTGARHVEGRHPGSPRPGGVRSPRRSQLL